MENKYLDDPEYLFALLTAIVKREGGELTISEEEIEQVTKNDLMGMYWKPKRNELILKILKTEDVIRNPMPINTDEVFEN